MEDEAAATVVAIDRTDEADAAVLLTAGIKEAAISRQAFPPAERLAKNGVSVELAFQAVLPGAKVTWNARIDGQPATVARPAYGRKHHTAVTCPIGVRREYRSVPSNAPLP